MNPFVSRITHRNDQWIWPLTAMCLVLGFMLSMAWVNKATMLSRYSLLEPTQQSRINEAEVDLNAVDKLQKEVISLRADNTKLQNGLAQGSVSSRLLNDSLQETKLFAGLTAVEGPGMTVTLKDSARGPMKLGDQVVYTQDMNIHDVDVLKVVNELYSAGAEAVAVNDHRLAGPSSIRCVGPTILINDVKVATPITVKAIGDTKTLMGAMNLNGGVLSEVRSTDPNMVSLEEDKDIKLEPFSGRTDFRFAKAPKDQK